jgi:cation:H+ antiporter
MTSLLIVIAGLVTLVLGGELFIKGATRLATLMGMSPLVIGLTVVAFGTSAPELGVSLQAALDDHASIAVGNVTGSNIFNVLGVLGLSALASPLIIHTNLVKFDVPVMIFISVLMLLLSLDGSLTTLDGLVLLTLMAAYIWLLLREAQREKKKNLKEGVHEKVPHNLKSYLQIILLFIGGLLGLVYGSRWLVEGAVQIAKAFDVSERLIGLTIVAIGTSLPELITSLMAAIRGERDLAVGNVVGSNIINILLILGSTAVLSPSPLYVEPNSLTEDMPFVIFAAALCFPFFLRKIMYRWVGGLFVALYIGYIVYLLKQ